MTSACPSAIELERAFWSGDAQVSQHARGCARCEGEWDEIAKLASHADALAPAPLSADRREELRATILSKVERSAAAPSHLRWPIILVPLAAAAAALLLWWALPSSSHHSVSTDRRSTVLDHEGARYLVASIQPDEIVRLVDGSISLRVDTLVTSERFRVIAGNAEIESRNGAFDVTARADALTSVRVISGEVVVRASNETKTLRAGESWPLRQPPTATATATAPRTSSTVPHAPSTVPRAPSTVPRAPSTETETETATETTPPTPPTPAMLAFDDAWRAMRAFDDAWRAMRASDFRTAAAAFDRAALSDDAGPLAEDARFWRAAALARANRTADAIAAFTSFLDRHPRAVRAGEASAMLGWLLLDRGQSTDLDRAATLFTAATRDPSPRVRESAARGLRAVGAASAH